MSRSLASSGMLILLCANPLFAQVMDEGGCVYNRKIHPERTELCQDGTLKRCEEGAWSDVGDCPVEAPEPPDPRGGDEVEPQE